jgi:hypothetical protein
MRIEDKEKPAYLLGYAYGTIINFLSTARTVFYQSQQQDNKGLLLRAPTGGSVVFFTMRRRQFFLSGISFVR